MTMGTMVILSEANDLLFENSRFFGLQRRAWQQGAADK